MKIWELKNQLLRIADWDKEVWVEGGPGEPDRRVEGLIVRKGVVLLQQVEEEDGEEYAD